MTNKKKKHLAAEVPPSPESNEEMEEEEIKFTINQKFAQQYNEKKQRDELSRYNSFLKEEEDEEDSDEEDDEHGALVTAEIDKQILRTLALIKKKDPIVYDKNQTFYSDEDLIAAKKEWEEHQTKLQKEKKYTLADYEKEMMMTEGPEFFGKESDEEDNDGDEKQKRPLNFTKEQMELKKAFLESAKTIDGEDTDEEEGDGSDKKKSKSKSDNFLQIKKKTREDLEKENEEYEKFLLDTKASKGKSKAGKEYSELETLKRYWVDPNLDDDEKFLRDYVLKRGWIEKDENELDFDLGEHDSTDEEYDDVAEEFEHRYNFRHEEEGGATVAHYPREIPDSVRRDDSKRAETRKKKKEQKELEKQQREETLNRMKKVKEQELKKQLKKIQQISGAPINVNDIDLDGEFDPEEFDKQMEKIFNDEYYELGAEDDEEELLNLDDEERKLLGIENPIDGYEEVGDDEGGSDRSDDEEKTDASGSENREDEESEGESESREEEDENEMEIDEEEEKKKKKEKEKKKKKKEKEKKKKKLEEETSDKKKKEEKKSKDDRDIHKDKELVKEKKKQLSELTESVKAVSKLVGEYRRIDHQNDFRFRYREVPKADFGLSVEEVLMADDADLNSYVSLKKLAPYRPPEVQERDIQKLSKKKRLRQFKLKLLEKEINKNKNQVTLPHIEADGDTVLPAQRTISNTAKVSDDRATSYLSHTKKRRLEKEQHIQEQQQRKKQKKDKRKMRQKRKKNATLKQQQE